MYALSERLGIDPLYHWTGYTPDKHPKLVLARKPLEDLEVEIIRVERPPFENRYRKTWIRRETKLSNVHRSYEQLRVCMSSQGTRSLIEPEDASRPDLTKFMRMW